MKKLGVLILIHACLATVSAAAQPIKVASWNLGWHVSQGEVPNWIARCGRSFLKDPGDGEVLQTDFSACAALKANPKASDFAAGTPLATLNAAFNRHYSIMLNQIELAFNGNPTLLYEAITNGMHGLAGIAYVMVRTPVPDQADVFGCPSFEWMEQVSDSNSTAQHSNRKSRCQFRSTVFKSALASRSQVGAFALRRSISVCCASSKKWIFSRAWTCCPV